MPQAVFSRAVQSYLPTAIPTNLEKIDEYSVGKILVYSKRPRKLIPMRKHKLDFTGFSLESLLSDGEALEINTGRTFLFDTEKSTSKKQVNVDLEGDLDLDSLLTKLFSSKLGTKASAGELKSVNITTDFGKLTHVASDLVTTIAKGKLRVNTDHAVVQKAVKNGGVMFVITDIYEAEKCDISVSLSEDKKESVEMGGEVKVEAKADESVDDKHSSSTGKRTLQPLHGGDQ